MLTSLHQPNQMAASNISYSLVPSIPNLAKPKWGEGRIFLTPCQKFHCNTRKLVEYSQHYWFRLCKKFNLLVLVKQCQSILQPHCSSVAPQAPIKSPKAHSTGRSLPELVLEICIRNTTNKLYRNLIFLNTKYPPHEIGQPYIKAKLDVITDVVTSRVLLVVSSPNAGHIITYLHYTLVKVLTV